MLHHSTGLNEFVFKENTANMHSDLRAITLFPVAFLINSFIMGAFVRLSTLKVDLYEAWSKLNFSYSQLIVFMTSVLTIMIFKIVCFMFISIDIGNNFNDFIWISPG